MEKIVIVTNQPEGDIRLIALLHILFPECEICIAPNMREALAYSKEKGTEEWRFISFNSHSAIFNA